MQRRPQPHLLPCRQTAPPAAAPSRRRESKVAPRDRKGIQSHSSSSFPDSVTQQVATQGRFRGRRSRCQVADDAPTGWRPGQTRLTVTCYRARSIECLPRINQSFDHSCEIDSWLRQISLKSGRSFEGENEDPGVLEGRVFRLRFVLRDSNLQSFQFGVPRGWSGSRRQGRLPRSHGGDELCPCLVRKEIRGDRKVPPPSGLLVSGVGRLPLPGRPVVTPAGANLEG